MPVLTARALYTWNTHLLCHIYFAQIWYKYDKLKMLMVVYVLTPFCLCAYSKLYVVHCVWLENSDHHGIQGLFVSSTPVWPCCILRPLSLELPWFCSFCLVLSQPFLSLYAGLSHYYCRIHEVTHGLVLYLVLVESFCKDLYVGVCGSGSDRGFMSLLALGQAVLCVCNWLHRVLPQFNTLCCGCGISVEPSQMFCSGED